MAFLFPVNVANFAKLITSCKTLTPDRPTRPSGVSDHGGATGA
jgi:hypothetical protein